MRARTYGEFHDPNCYSAYRIDAVRNAVSIRAKHMRVQAVSKDGKPLAGAAKTAFIKKCKREACEPKAVSADGKPLAGAAKNSFLKKCQAGA